MPSTLPTSVEATVLVNPNLQVFSEELKAKIDDERHLHLRLTRLKLKKAGKLDVFEQSSSGQATSAQDGPKPKKGTSSASKAETKKRNK